MSFSAKLRNENDALWQRWLPHPFTRALAEGSLEEAVFRRWLAQDYLFVSEGLRFLGVLLAKAPHGLLDALSDTIHTWKTELGLFREAAGALGVDLATRPYFVTRAYLDFLLAVGHQEPFAVGWATLLGVEKSYHDAWRWVYERTDAGHPYRAWIGNWGSDTFAAFVGFLENTLDELAPALGEAEREAARRRFAETARYEVLFWEMAWHGEQFE